MKLPTSFATFLSEIRPTDTQSTAMQRGHRVLRERLQADSVLWNRVIGTFIQGSYRRMTAIRAKSGERSDVDVVVVTNLPQSRYPGHKYTAAEAQGLFYDFADRHYRNKWRPQGRSIGIELSDVDVDLVITSAPSEEQQEVLKAVNAYAINEFDTVFGSLNAYSALSMYDNVLAKAETPQWKLEPLYIPNIDQNCWDPTHPLAQFKWTWEKNRSTSSHYVNIVKVIKWWRRINPRLTVPPKGYPLEHLIGQCCPNGIGSVAEGVTLTFEAIVSRYGAWADQNLVPNLQDHGVPSHNVLARVQPSDFATFMGEVRAAAVTARVALDAPTNKASADKWRELLGTKFPESKTSESGLLKTESASGLSFPDKPISPNKPGGFA